MAKNVMCSVFLLFILSLGYAQLSPTFYDQSCPSLIYTVRGVLQKAVQKETRIAASLLRLHFHDCFVNGCDASILLDDTKNSKGEKTANPNRNSARGFDVVDDVKNEVEKKCKGVVSCADILAIIARESVTMMNGPTWTLQLGRRDSTSASLSAANNDIPPPTSTLSQLVSKFQTKGLSTQDLVALSGSHTIGQARCVNFRDRLYNFSGSAKPDSTLDRSYLGFLQNKCPKTSGNGDNNISPLDFRTPTGFDGLYYNNLQANKGLLNSDQVLYSTGASASKNLVTTYGGNQAAFFKDFANAMVKMGNITPLTGANGQIRKSCRVVN